MLKFFAAALPVAVLGATAASAHLAAPLVPSALVEDVKGTTDDVEFMDYVGKGQVINLGAGDVLVLSYLKSCEFETITGGTVMVGADRSEVRDGKVVRAKVPCNGGKIQLSSFEASKSGASAFRVQSADIQPLLYGLAPVVLLPKVMAGDDRTLLIERVDHPQERYEIRIDEGNKRFYDLATTDTRLRRGAVYKASIGGHDMIFKIAAKAKSGPMPVVSRLLRFQ